MADISRKRGSISNDVPGADVVLLDTGHFALEEVGEIATPINKPTTRSRC